MLATKTAKHPRDMEKLKRVTQEKNEKRAALRGKRISVNDPKYPDVLEEAVRKRYLGSFSNRMLDKVVKFFRDTVPRWFLPCAEFKPMSNFEMDIEIDEAAAAQLNLNSSYPDGTHDLNLNSRSWVPSGYDEL